MKIFKKNQNVIIMCVIELVVGILLLIDPVKFTAGILIVIGIALMVVGSINVIRYFRSSPEEAMVGQHMAHGLISLLAGAFCTFNPGWFILAFPVITILFGVAVLLAGLSKVQLAIDMLRLRYNKWWWGAVSAAISIICAIVILCNPFSSTAALWCFTGISLIAEAVFDLITLILKSRKDQDQDNEIDVN